MKVNLASLQDRAGWEKAGVRLPAYDIMEMRKKTIHQVMIIIIIIIIIIVM